MTFVESLKEFILELVDMSQLFNKHLEKKIFHEYQCANLPSYNSNFYYSHKNNRIIVIKHRVRIERTLKIGKYSLQSSAYMIIRGSTAEDYSKFNLVYTADTKDFDIFTMMGKLLKYHGVYV